MDTSTYARAPGSADECDVREMKTLIGRAVKMDVSEKRKALGIIRDNSTEDEFLPWFGTTLGQLCVALVLAEK